MTRIAVDLTPILPSGENGGAKIMTIELLRNMGKLASNSEFILLTTESNHEELAILDSSNIRRFCVNQKSDDSIIKQISSSKIDFLKKLIQKLPIQIKVSVFSKLQKIRHKKTHSLLKNLAVDLLFCPFTAPFYFENNIPLVTVIYDLQSYYYPTFFTAEDRFYRAINFFNACKFASRIICISDYVKETIYQNTTNSLPVDKVKTIHIALSNRLPEPSQHGIETIKRFGLQENNFLLYPANFWPHKNHEMLLTAYSIYRNKNNLNPLKLVCTGFPCKKMEELKNAVVQMGFTDSIQFPGYVTNQEFRTLIDNCKAVIFPSLYEGFGMPILEAMALGKPVLCSNVTSLPEVAGDAALLFDPRKPGQIAEAMLKIEMNENELLTDLVSKGKERVKQFGDSVNMAEEYLDVFRNVLEEKVKVALC